VRAWSAVVVLFGRVNFIKFHKTHSGSGQKNVVLVLLTHRVQTFTALVALLFFCLSCIKTTTVYLKLKVGTIVDVDRVSVSVSVSADIRFWLDVVHSEEYA